MSDAISGRKTEEASAACPVCDRKTLARRKAVDHAGHLLLAIITAGIWMPIWLTVLVHAKRQPYRCMQCGSLLRDAGPGPATWELVA